MGIDSASGDTYAAERDFCTLESMFVPDPVIKIAVSPKSRSDGDKMGKALQRFRKEDPTFRVFTDDETNEILISGMGELHLEVYIERIRREYGVEIEVGAPKVSYRESPTRAVEFDYKHKKQSGGSGQYGKIQGKIIPIDEGDFVFENVVTGGNVPARLWHDFMRTAQQGLPVRPLPTSGAVRPAPGDQSAAASGERDRVASDSWSDVRD